MTPYRGHFFPKLSVVFRALESWRSNNMISTNQSTVSRRIWTNESVPPSPGDGQLGLDVEDSLLVMILLSLQPALQLLDLHGRLLHQLDAPA